MFLMDANDAEANEDMCKAYRFQGKMQITSWVTVQSLKNDSRCDMLPKRARVLLLR